MQQIKQRKNISINNSNRNNGAHHGRARVKREVLRRARGIAADVFLDIPVLIQIVMKGGAHAQLTVEKMDTDKKEKLNSTTATTTKATTRKTQDEVSSLVDSQALALEALAERIALTFRYREFC